MITEETGIPEDSIGDTYNRIITDNIIHANKNKEFGWDSSEKFADAEKLLGDIQVSGENKEELC